MTHSATSFTVVNTSQEDASSPSGNSRSINFAHLSNSSSVTFEFVESNHFRFSIVCRKEKKEKQRNFKLFMFFFIFLPFLFQKKNKDSYIHTFNQEMISFLYLKVNFVKKRNHQMKTEKLEQERN
jgi:broad specificity polyphosphatase/5'/3'-nucleotidase SurE